MLIALILAAATPIPQATCQGVDDCAVKWGRATRWVLDHNPRIAEQNETRIVNAPVAVTGSDLYQVTRIQEAGGRQTFDIRVECANFISCKWKQRKREFAAFVMADQ